jgi:hypothetical protein
MLKTPCCIDCYRDGVRQPPSRFRVFWLGPENLTVNEPLERIECMEVWGGSQLTSRGVQLGGLDAWVVSKPHGGAQRGGDVYYASSCGTGRISRLLLADVSGHGQAVAAIASDLRMLMRRYVNCIDQSEFVRRLNQQFNRIPRDGAYATSVVTTFFAPSRRLTVTNAGHPRPLLFRAASRTWDFLGLPHAPAKPGVRNIPLGLIGITEYDHFDLELSPGDRFLAYTDALIESCDADGEMLGENGLLKIVRLLDELPPERQIQSLLDEIGRRYPKNLSDDDVTVLLVHANNREIHYSLREKTGAMLRFLKTALRAINPRAERPPLPDFKFANLAGAFIPAIGRRWRAPQSTSANRENQDA